MARGEGDTYCGHGALRLLVWHPSLTAAQLRQLHAQLLTSSLLADRFLPNNLLREAASAPSPLRALRLFPRLRRILLRDAFLPNNYTFSFLLTAAAAIAAPPPDAAPRRRLVCALHALAAVLGWDAHAYVANGLIHAYASHGLLRHARQVFDDGSRGSRDACSWTSLLTGYARAGRLQDARSLFDDMPHRTPVAWSAMLSAHVAAGGFADALEVFDGMLRARVRPNRAAVVGALAACGALGALEQGRWLHALVAGRKEVDGVVATALVDMYGKCGSLDAATQVFAGMPERERDVFAYTAMISALSDHGRCREAIEVFDRMQQGRGVRPNEVTFICVLSACARAGGLVARAKEMFRSMSAVYGMDPGVEHYGSLVDVLGRAGLLSEAVDVVRSMPMRPDSYVLGALLNACRVHGGGDGVEVGKQVVEWLAELGLDHSGVHVQLSNMYACSSKWEDVVKVRTAMEEKKVAKVPGCSMVDVDGVAHEFVAGSHDPWIAAVVRELDGQLRLLGHDSSYLDEEFA